MGLPAVAGLLPTLGAPINRSGPAGCLAGRPRPPGVLGLPGNIPARGGVPVSTLIHGGTGGTVPGQQRPPPPAQDHSPLEGPLPAGLDRVHLLGTRIPTMRRVPIAATSTCARALTCLQHALEQEQTRETLTRLLVFPRIALAAPARGCKATRSSSTQQWPAQLPGVRHGPTRGTDRPHTPAGDDRWPPHAGPE